MKWAKGSKDRGYPLSSTSYLFAMDGGRAHGALPAETGMQCASSDARTTRAASRRSLEDRRTILVCHDRDLVTVPTEMLPIRW